MLNNLIYHRGKENVAASHIDDTEDDRFESPDGHADDNVFFHNAQSDSKLAHRSTRDFRPSSKDYSQHTAACLNTAACSKCESRVSSSMFYVAHDQSDTSLVLLGVGLEVMTVKQEICGLKLDSGIFDGKRTASTVVVQDLLSGKRRYHDSKELFGCPIFVTFSPHRRVVALQFRMYDESSIETNENSDDEELEDDMDGRKFLSSAELLCNLIDSHFTGNDLYCLRSFTNEQVNHRMLKMLDDLIGYCSNKIEDLSLRSILEADRNIFACSVNRDRFLNNFKTLAQKSDCRLAKDAFTPLEIVFLTPEYRGISVVGGVGFMVADLAVALRMQSQKSIVITPQYEGNHIESSIYLKTEEIQIGSQLIPFDIRTVNIDSVQIYLIVQPYIFAKPYKTSKNTLSRINQLFAQSAMAVKVLELLNFDRPVVVNNDWVFGLCPALYKQSTNFNPTRVRLYL